MKRKKYTYYVLILWVLVIFTGCQKNVLSSNENKQNHTEITHYNDDFVSYCAKENNGKNNIYFNYPLFKSEVKNSDALNQIILNYVKMHLDDNRVWDNEIQEENKAWEPDDQKFMGELKGTPETSNWQEGNYTNIIVNVNYEIQYYDSNYVSITFKGLWGHKRSPYISKFFSALTIDLVKCQAIELSDLYNIDETFLETIKKEHNMQIADRFNSERGIAIDKEDIESEWFNVFSDESDKSEQLEYLRSSKFFLTEKELGIIMYFENVIGGPLEIYIDYEKLEPFKE